MNKNTFQAIVRQYVNEPYAREEGTRLNQMADSHRDYANQIEKFDPEAAGIMRAAAEGYAEIADKQTRLIEHFKKMSETDLSAAVSRLANEIVGYKR